MEHIVSTVFFDGRFWIALIERIDHDDGVSVGKHTFGPEPTNNDLIAFYLSRAHLVPMYPGDSPPRLPKVKALKAEERGTRKSFAAFKELQKAALIAAQKENRSASAEEKDEQFLKKAEKRKKKKRGH